MKAKNKNRFNDFAWVKVKTKQNKKILGWGKKVLCNRQCFASLPLYSVGGAMVPFVIVTGELSVKINPIRS